jgi:8-oxo-dGTP pyrophosphatase MutT (NUDIX family)
MQVDPRLNEIDDCLYRVAVRVLIVHDDKVLLVQEFPQLWWAFPGGGIDYGEGVESTLPREVEEELGIPAEEVSSDYKLVFYEFSGIVEGIPRLNLFFKATIPIDLLSKTSEIEKWQWYTKEELLKLRIIPFYNKKKLVEVIFGS